MGYKAGVDKNQISFLPVCLDDFVGENHICRVINAFTELLDMEKLGYKYSVCQKTGCPPYSPKIMLNLYIYGYLHGVNSSRKLRDEAQRNIEVMCHIRREDLGDSSQVQRNKKLPNEVDIQKALEKLKSRKKKFKNLLSRIEQEKGGSTVDPDSPSTQCY